MTVVLISSLFHFLTSAFPNVLYCLPLHLTVIMIIIFKQITFFFNCLVIYDFPVCANRDDIMFFICFVTFDSPFLMTLIIFCVYFFDLLSWLYRQFHGFLWSRTICSLILGMFVWYFSTSGSSGMSWESLDNVYWSDVGWEIWIPEANCFNTRLTLITQFPVMASTTGTLPTGYLWH